MRRIVSLSSSSLSVVTDCWKATTRAVGFGADGGPGQVTEAVSVWLTTKLTAYKSCLSATAWVSTCRPQSLTAKLKHLVLRTYISRPRFEGWMHHEPAYSSCLDQLENTASWCSQPSDRLRLMDSTGNCLSSFHRILWKSVDCFCIILLTNKQTRMKI